MVQRDREQGTTIRTDKRRGGVLDQSQAMKRRDFLARSYDAGKIGLVGLVLGRWSVFAALGNCASERGEGRPIMLDEVTTDLFEAHLGSSFYIHHDSGLPLTVKLIEATPLTTSGEARSVPTKREPCSIIFRGPLEPVLPQQIYRIQHDSLGRMDLFLVPVGPDEEGMRYEAVFN